ncbi:MAG: HIT domain-containing protein [Candidatus Nanopelagicales bacterium]|jgi:ATP adenylyltransferase|nr:HIT domain-containing protein [Candidatus Nanopelagicales bacterium]
MGHEEWDRLWVPHRMPYIRGESRPPTTDAGADCPFCLEDGAEDSLVVARGPSAFVVMNLFPYNPGHLLICPYRHVADYTELTGEERAELNDWQDRMMRALRAASGPHGFNIGLNQGPAAGAGISGHLHQHIVPRWRGDANFITTVGGARTMVMLLEETRDLLARTLAELG